MSAQLDSTLAAMGVAQAIVVLKPPAAPATKLTEGLAAAIPVKSSRKAPAAPAKTLADVAKCFRFSEAGQDSALAQAARAHKRKSAGLNWFERARKGTGNKEKEPPQARYFPNLGVMFGTIDAQGLAALRAHNEVDQVLAPPVPSLIRPVRLSSAKASKAYTWGIKRLRVDQLHDKGLTGDGVIVGHLDTGADGTHPALRDAFAAFAEFDLMGFEVSPAPAPRDTDEHGTHTAGTIAGRTKAGRAIGVAPDAQLASAIVIEGGNVIARILAGLDWVIGKQAKVLSMSLGLRGFQEDFVPLVQILRARGVLPVFAVGNEGAGTSRSPGNYAEALSVGAMDRLDDVADFSSSQRFVRASDPLVPDLVAPGVDIVSAMPGGGYQAMDGTSMATPHIAGLAALLFQAVPGASIDQVERSIFESCQPLMGDPVERQNRGVPDALVALTKLGG